MLDGIRTKVSVGYVIHAATLTEKGEDIDTYRVTDWEPYECSLVSVPADATVGVGRSAEDSPIVIIENDDGEDAAAVTHSEIPVIEEVFPMTMTVEEAVKSARVEEQKRSAEIIAIGEKFAQFGAEALARDAIGGGVSVDGDPDRGDVAQGREAVARLGGHVEGGLAEAVHAVAELGDGVVGADRCPGLGQGLESRPSARVRGAVGDAGVACQVGEVTQPRELPPDSGPLHAGLDRKSVV